MTDREVTLTAVAAGRVKKRDHRPNSQCDEDHSAGQPAQEAAVFPSRFPDTIFWEADVFRFRRKCLILFGALGEIRTPDPRNRNPIVNPSTG
jgi:hypothetical protein